VIGLLVCALVLLLSAPAPRPPAGAAVNFFVMLGGIYYPNLGAAGWVQAILAAIPLTYFSDGSGRLRLPVPRFAYPSSHRVRALAALRDPRALGARFARLAPSDPPTGLLLKLLGGDAVKGGASLKLTMERPRSA